MCIPNWVAKTDFLILYSIDDLKYNFGRGGGLTNYLSQIIKYIKPLSTIAAFEKTDLKSMFSTSSKSSGRALVY